MDTLYVDTIFLLETILFGRIISPNNLKTTSTSAMGALIMLGVNQTIQSTQRQTWARMQRSYEAYIKNNYFILYVLGIVTIIEEIGRK